MKNLYFQNFHLTRQNNNIKKNQKINTLIDFSTSFHVFQRNANNYVKFQISMYIQSSLVSITVTLPYMGELMFL